MSFYVSHLKFCMFHFLQLKKVNILCFYYRVIKNWCFWTWCWRRLASPLDCKEIQPVHPKGNQSWIFIGRADALAETPILWLPDTKNWLFVCWCWERLKVGGEWDGRRWDGWHHQLDGHKFEYALGVGDGQGSLACCSPWGCKELDMTELNWPIKQKRMYLWHIPKLEEYKISTNHEIKWFFLWTFLIVPCKICIIPLFFMKYCLSKKKSIIEKVEIRLDKWFLVLCIYVCISTHNYL